MNLIGQRAKGSRRRKEMALVVGLCCENMTGNIMEYYYQKVWLVWFGLIIE